MARTLDVNRFCTAISNYIEQEIIPQYGGLLAFGAEVISSIISRNGVHLVNSYSSLLIACKLMTSKGEIDIDELAAVLGATFDRLQKVSVGGLTYSKNDLDKFVEIMQSYIPTTAVK